MENESMLRQKTSKQLNTLKNILCAIKEDPSLTENISSFVNLADTIQDLEIETHLHQKSKIHRNAYELLHHFLFTPWGAPFVMNHSLLESAQTYKFQEHKKSELYYFIQDFIHYDKESEQQIFESLDNIIHAFDLEDNA